MSTAHSSPLPMRDGVSPSCVVLPSGDWPSIAAFLCARFPAIAAEEWAARMAAGDVVDEFGQTVSAARPFQAGLRVFYYRALAAETPIPFEERVLFQDELLVVADKPHFLPVTPGGRYLQETLLVRLKRKLGIATLSPIHRIDRETAGLVVFAVQPATRGRYHALFAERAVEKCYEAVAPFRVDLALPCTYRSRLVDAANFMQMRTEAGEPNAETHIELLEQAGALARYRLSPLTGRRHQLRMHCAALGMPILHDRIYPELLPENTDDYARPLQLLARRIAFRDPVSGVERCFESQRSLMPLAEAGL
ncbi:pseudouridine synthase [Uliginosibacterium sp. 31-16]|uniref:pseudouridine synthase n=1 Tax=Uliginosibacterium sp. 31-16 TaxID=3068315 RepID=UPI00273F37AD|nr:pseudouridine synthase [Uliginosibacterium sp. 31-16]MDP5239734.1 pseudouridine synthase [Uliginosibacterium sp. 31-16]